MKREAKLETNKSPTFSSFYLQICASPSMSLESGCPLRDYLSHALWSSWVTGSLPWKMSRNCVCSEQSRRSRRTYGFLYFFFKVKLTYYIVSFSNSIQSFTSFKVYTLVPLAGAGRARVGRALKPGPWLLSPTPEPTSPKHRGLRVLHRWRRHRRKRRPSSPQPEKACTQLGSPRAARKINLKNTG